MTSQSADEEAEYIRAQCFAFLPTEADLYETGKYRWSPWEYYLYEIEQLGYIGNPNVESFDNNG